MSTIFISHSSRDNAAAAELQRRLESKGHRSVFLDFDPEKGIVSGVSWERTLYTKLKACSAVVALCTDSYLASKWCFAEIALARMEGKHMFVLLADPMAEDTELPSIMQEDQYGDLRSDPEDAYFRLWNGFRVKGITPQEHREWGPEDPPYPGLRAFEERDAPIFFGRDKEVRDGVELLNQVRRQGSPRLVMVLGASGCGKSSLTRAGLVPRLRRDEIQWLVTEPFRPGSEPLRELAAAFSRAFDSVGSARSGEDIHQELQAWRRAGPSGEPGERSREAPTSRDDLDATAARQRLVRAMETLEAELGATDSAVAASLQQVRDFLERTPTRDAGQVHERPLPRSDNPLVNLASDLRRRGGPSGACVTLVIDQFEELLGHDSEAAHPANHFLALLRDALDVENSPLLALATMRSDYLGAFQRSAPLIGVGFKSISVGPMSMDGMREVIERPAQLGQIQLEDGLSERLLRDTGTPDALPLLAFVLQVMWERFRDDRLLEIREYEELGGLQGAIAQVADETLSSALESGDEAALRDTFLKLARPTEEGRAWARQALHWDQLGAAERPMLQRFVDQRLLVRQENGTVEVAHEALFRSWEKLRGWLAENAESLHLLREIQVDAKKWEKAKSDAEKEPYLFRGGRLARALELRQAGVMQLQDLDRTFVEASDRAERAQAEAEELRRRKELRRARIFAAVVGVAFLAAFSFWRVAETQRRAAELSRKMTLAEIHKRDPVLGRSITREVLGHPRGWMAIAADQIRNRMPEVHLLPNGKDERFNAVAFGSEGRFAAANSEGEIWLWEPDEEPRSVGEHEAHVWDVAFSLSGDTLASSDDDGIVKIWEVGRAESGQPPKILPHEEMGSALRVRLSEDGKLAAVLTEKGEGGDRSVTLWSLEKTTQQGDLVHHQMMRQEETGGEKTQKVTALALSPDGSRLLLGYRSGALVRRFTTSDDVAKRELIHKHEAEVRQAVFDASGDQIASADRDGSVWWRLPSGERAMRTKWAQPDPLALRLAGDHIFVAGVDQVYVGELRELREGEEAPPFFPEFFDVSIGDADYDAGRLITTLEGRGGVSIWTVDRAPEPRRLAVANETCADCRAMDVAYLDGDRLLAAYECGTVRLWFSLDPDPARVDRGPQAQVLYPPPGETTPTCATPLAAMAASRDGQRYALLFGDGRILVGEIQPGTEGAAPREYRPQPAVASRASTAAIAFDEAAGSLAVGLENGRVGVLDLADGSWTDVGAHEKPVRDIDWARRSDRLVSTSSDEAPVRVWTQDRQGEGRYEEIRLPHGSGVYAASFDATGRFVVTGGEDSLVRVWDLDQSNPVSKPVELSEHEFHQKGVRDVEFSPDGKWVLSGGSNILGMSCHSPQKRGATAPCTDGDEMVLVYTPNPNEELGIVRAVAVSPEGPQFAAVDESGELNLFRTDFRTALWQQQTDCLPVATRMKALRESARQAEDGFQQCLAMVQRCMRSTQDCERALARTLPK